MTWHTIFVVFFVSSAIALAAALYLAQVRPVRILAVLAVSFGALTIGQLVTGRSVVMTGVAFVLALVGMWWTRRKPVALPDCPNRFDSIVSEWCTAPVCKCGRAVIPPPPPRRSPVTPSRRFPDAPNFGPLKTEDRICIAGDEGLRDRASRLHRVTRNPDGSFASVEPLFASPVVAMDAHANAITHAWDEDAETMPGGAA